MRVFTKTQQVSTHPFAMSFSKICPSLAKVDLPSDLSKVLGDLLTLRGNVCAAWESDHVAYLAAMRELNEKASLPEAKYQAWAEVLHNMGFVFQGPKGTYFGMVPYKPGSTPQLFQGPGYGVTDWFQFSHQNTGTFLNYRYWVCQRPGADENFRYYLRQTWLRMVVIPMFTNIFISTSWSQHQPKREWELRIGTNPMEVFIAIKGADLRLCQRQSFKGNFTNTPVTVGNDGRLCVLAQGNEPGKFLYYPVGGCNCRLFQNRKMTTQKCDGRLAHVLTPRFLIDVQKFLNMVHEFGTVRVPARSEWTKNPATPSRGLSAPESTSAVKLVLDKKDFPHLSSNKNLTAEKPVKLAPTPPAVVPRTTPPRPEKCDSEVTFTISETGNAPLPLWCLLHEARAALFHLITLYIMTAIGDMTVEIWDNIPSREPLIGFLDHLRQHAYRLLKARGYKLGNFALDKETFRENLPPTRAFVSYEINGELGEKELKELQKDFLFMLNREAVFMQQKQCALFSNTEDEILFCMARYLYIVVALLRADPGVCDNKRTSEQEDSYHNVVDQVITTRTMKAWLDKKRVEQKDR